MPKFETWRDAGIEKKGTGRRKVLCPKCKGGDGRQRSVYVNFSNGAFKCFRASCDYKGQVMEATGQVVSRREYKPIPKERFGSIRALREPDPSKPIYGKVETWLRNTRGLTEKTIHSDDLAIREGVMMYDTKGVGVPMDVIAFLYLDNQDVMMCKYRSSDKRIRQEQGGVPTLYRLNHIKESDDCIITEGEFDALSFVEAGYDYSVSIPNGAADKAMDWIVNNIEHLEFKKTIYLAVDMDEPGLALREELARRLGKTRCKIVTFPDGCKDANETLVKYGPQALANCVLSSTPYPIEGVVDIRDVFDVMEGIRKNGYPKGAQTGTRLDDIITWHKGEITTVTGHANHGKTPFIINLICKLAIHSGWKSALFSPEYSSYAINAMSMIQTIIGRPVVQENTQGYSYVSDAQFRYVSEYIRDMIKEIRPDNANYNIDSILDIAEYLVSSMGLDMLVIDHWKTIDLPNDMDQRNGSKEILNKLKRFAVANDVHVIIVAHPSSKQHLRASDDFNLTEITSLAQVAESGEFINLSDNGISIHRHFDKAYTYNGGRADLYTSIRTLKIKNSWVGRVGSTYWLFNYRSNRYDNIPPDKFRELKMDQEDLQSRNESCYHIYNNSIPRNEVCWLVGDRGWDELSGQGRPISPQNIQQPTPQFDFDDDEIPF